MNKWESKRRENEEKQKHQVCKNRWREGIHGKKRSMGVTSTSHQSICEHTNIVWPTLGQK